MLLNLLLVLFHERDEVMELLGKGEFFVNLVGIVAGWDLLFSLDWLVSTVLIFVIEFELEV